MPYHPFQKPISFLNALEHFSFALTYVMVALRDEANFHDNGDRAVLDAAEFFCSTLEDAHREAMTLADQLEKRMG